MGKTSQTVWQRGGKRVFDVVATVLLLVVCAPVFLVVAILIRLTSPGPVFFMQDRGGWHGENFRPYKFRTMTGGRTPDPKELVPLAHPDITAIGRFLRRFKLDELPQLFNVLSGQMSLIGPRPTLPDQVAAYDDFRRQRLLVRPGLTGLAQVNSNADVSWDERILYDIAYVRRCSFLLDASILFRTIRVVLGGEKRTTRPFLGTVYAKIVALPDGYSVSQ